VKARYRALVVIVLVACITPALARAGSSQGGGPQQLGRLNTWSARSSTGTALAGTWTGGVDPRTGAASGTWTLLDANGRATVRGGWSAIKSARGWSGSWRANVVGSRAEYGGTWNATVDVKAQASFADLFALALQNAVSGTWRAGTGTGSWSIRAYTSTSNDQKP
jgi:hypothetical protein